MGVCIAKYSYRQIDDGSASLLTDLDIQMKEDDFDGGCKDVAEIALGTAGGRSDIDSLVNMFTFLEMKTICGCMRTSKLLRSASKRALILTKELKVVSKSLKYTRGMLVVAARYCPRLTELRLSKIGRNEISLRTCFKEVTACIEACPRIEKIWLQEASIGSKAGLTAHAARSLHNLRKLVLSQQDLPFYSLELVILGKRCKRLESLELHGSYHSKAEFETFQKLEGIKQILRGCSLLHTLWLKRFSGVASAFGEFDGELTHLRTLGLRQCQLSDSDCGKISRAAPNLVKLHLGGNMNVGDDGVRQLANNWSEKTPIEELELSGTSVTEGIVLLLSTFQHLSFTARPTLPYDMAGTDVYMRLGTDKVCW